MERWVGKAQTDFEVSPDIDIKDASKYWSQEARLERLRIVSKYAKYYTVTTASIEAMGGIIPFCHALESYGGHILVVSLPDELFEDEWEDSDLKLLLQSLCALESLTTVVCKKRNIVDEIKVLKPEIVTTTDEGADHIPTTQKEGVYWVNISVTDAYYRGEPYLLFSWPGSSCCVFNFKVEEEGHYVLPLKHCFTSGRGKIEIKLDGSPVAQSWDKSRLVRDSLMVEEINLSTLKAGFHTVIITLDTDSSGVYWLSDVYAPRYALPESIP
ncbi:hypothetical protein B0H14DRAFT_2607400 [Mycena olivaceomarginata]|nr:hypothetical protein B0H14DRAFT_2607400 [Mycena olivaceomarginata]